MGCPTLPNATMQIVRHGASSGSPRLMDTKSQSDRCEPAAITRNGHDHDAMRSIIRHKAARMRFPNEVQRHRFVEKTMNLVRGH